MTDHKPVGYSVKPPENYKALKGKRVRLIIFYVALYVIPMLITVFGFGKAELIAYLMMPLAALTFVAVRMTWPKTRPEYDYTLEGGVFTLAAIYGGRIRHTKLELDLADAYLIAPKNGVYDGRIKEFSPQKTVKGVFEDEQSNYFVLYKDENDTPSIAHIYADEEAVKIMRLVCAKTYIR